MLVRPRNIKTSVPAQAFRLQVCSTYARFSSGTFHGLCCFQVYFRGCRVKLCRGLYSYRCPPPLPPMSTINRSVLCISKNRFAYGGFNVPTGARRVTFAPPFNAKKLLHNHRARRYRAQFRPWLVACRYNKRVLEHQATPIFILICPAVFRQAVYAYRFYFSTDIIFVTSVMVMPGYRYGFDNAVAVFEYIHFLNAVNIHFNRASVTPITRTTLFELHL